VEIHFGSNIIRVELRADKILKNSLFKN